MKVKCVKEVKYIIIPGFCFLYFQFLFDDFLLKYIYTSVLTTAAGALVLRGPAILGRDVRPLRWTGV